MLSPAERKYIQVRKAKGQRLNDGTVLLSDRFYSKAYQKVLDHRILKKWTIANEDIDLIRQHDDLCNKQRKTDIKIWKEYSKQQELKRKERYKPEAERTERKKQLLWELDQIELEEKRIWEPKIELGKKKELAVYDKSWKKFFRFFD